MKTVAEVIAKNVRALRTSAGLSQDQLADRLRSLYGLDWSRNSVAYAETGETEPSLSELLVLADALDVSTLHLLQHKGRVAISDRTSVPDVTAVVLGRAPVPQLPQRARSGNWRELQIRAASSGEAERHFAKKNDLDPEDVARISFELWGRSLTDERDERTGADAPAMKKAHATRKLGEELLARADTEGLR